MIALAFRLNVEFDRGDLIITSRFLMWASGWIVVPFNIKHGGEREIGRNGLMILC